MVHLGSSAIKFARYDERARELTIALKPSGLYVNVDVPQAVYQALLAAPSKGAFYNAHIRDCFSYKR